MSGGLAPFGQLPALAGFSPDDLAQLMQRIQGSLGQPSPSVAMNEGQVQGLERALASPQDRAALDGPSAIDRLLFDRGSMGSGRNGFAGTSGGSLPGAFEPRDVPLPPQRPSAEALMMPQPEPAITGGISGAAPAAGPVASGIVQPHQVSYPSRMDPESARALTGRPDGAEGGPRPDAGALPANAFDPLTGQPVSGNPTPLRAAQPAAPQAPGAAVGQGSPMQRFLGGIGQGNPELSNLLLNISAGLLSNRGIGQGIGAGLQSYQASRSGNLREQLQAIQFQQQIQAQNATRSYLRSKGLDPAAVEAATLNPSLLSQINKDPQQFTVDGRVYLGRADQPKSTWQELGSASGAPSGYRQNGQGGLDYIPGGPEDPAVKERSALAVATDKTQSPLTDIEARRKAGIPDHDTRTAWVDPYGKVTFNDGPPPLAARPGQTFYDRGTLKPILTAPSAKPDGFETEGKLRGEFAKGLGTFNDVHDGYGRVIAATKQRQENPNTVSPASDINLIFGFMKMLDPGSVVREGEYATAKNAAGVPERVLNTYNKVLSGEFLTDRQRQDFIGQAGQLYGTARKTAEGVADRYRGLANSYGVDPGRSVYLPDAPVPPRLGEPQAQAPQQTQTPAAIPQGAPDGTRLAPDGKFYAPDPKRPGRFLEVR